MLGLRGLAYAVHGTDVRLGRSAVAETGLVRKRGIRGHSEGQALALRLNRRHSVGQAVGLRLKGFAGNGGALSTVHTSGVALLGGDTALA